MATFWGPLSHDPTHPTRNGGGLELVPSHTSVLHYYYHYYYYYYYYSSYYYYYYYYYYFATSPPFI